MRAARLIFLITLVGLPIVTGQTAAPAAGRHPVILLTGDSVPMHLLDTFREEAATRGWRVVSAARGSCPVTGDELMDPRGHVIKVAAHCEEAPAEQDALIRLRDPAVVIWWDRWSLSDFRAGRRHVVSGTRRFWQIRARRLASAVDRLSASGARVAFVATEPTGTGVRRACTPERCNEWKRFLLDHFWDVTARWNHHLRGFALAHQRRTAYFNLNDFVCHVVASPCNDRIAGVPARGDGTHYGVDGSIRVVDEILRRLTPFMPAAPSG